MIIVQGVFRIAAEDRDQFIAETLETQQISRGEDGCLEYVFAADPLDDERIVLSELWESKDHLHAHGAALTARRKAAAEAGERRTEPLTSEIRFFEASEYTP